MRRLFIIRKDLHLSPGKLAAMVGHCAEAYWTALLSRSVTDAETGSFSGCIDPAVLYGYVRGRFTKTVCEARSLNHLAKAVDMARTLGMEEGTDYGFIDDACLTELTPEFTDDSGTPRCRVGIWFRPLPDGTAHAISRKFQLYRG